MEAELAAGRGWEAVLADLEECLRGAFTCEKKGQGEGQGEEDWMVNVDLLQDMLEAVSTVLNSFRPYLAADGDAASPSQLPAKQQQQKPPASSSAPPSGLEEASSVAAREEARALFKAQLDEVGRARPVCLSVAMTTSTRE